MFGASRLLPAVPILLCYMTLAAGLDKDQRPLVTVLVWDKVAGYLNWGNDWFKRAAAEKCSTRCVLKDDHAALPDADVIMFHAPTHTGLLPPRPRQRSVVYALLSMEQPRYARYLSDKAFLAKNFDLLATYSQQDLYPDTNIPNLPLSYFPLNILTPSAVLQPSRSFGSKTGYGTGVSVAIFVSNCKAAGAAQRHKYVEELAALIPIHSYGKCHKNRDEPEMAPDPGWPEVAQRRARKVKVLSHYKFYLAFENLQVDDYVSEKVYEGLFSGAVPVYRGAAQVSRFMPGNDSFIDANSLSPTELSRLLLRLKDDEAEYSRYLAFKRRPLPEGFVDVAMKSYTHPNVLCRLCEFSVTFKKGA